MRFPFSLSSPIEISGGKKRPFPLAIPIVERFLFPGLPASSPFPSRNRLRFGVKNFLSVFPLFFPPLPRHLFCYAVTRTSASFFLFPHGEDEVVCRAFASFFFLSFAPDGRSDELEELPSRILLPL